MIRFQYLGLLAHSFLYFTSVNSVTFNVIGYPSTEGSTFSVSIDGAITKLTTSEAAFPAWSVEVPDLQDTVQYKYIQVDGSGNTVEKEEFMRVMADKPTNEFFKRQKTIWTLPNIPIVYKQSSVRPTATRFQDNQISTIHLKTEETELQKLLSGASESATEIVVTFRFINAEKTHDLSNVKMMAVKNSLEFSKRSFKLSFFNTKEFLSRSEVLLEGNTGDPTMMRGKSRFLEIDLLCQISFNFS